MGAHDDRRDPRYDWPAELVAKAWPRLPLRDLVCGHMAPFWGEDARGVMQGWCRRCGRLVDTIWQPEEE